MKLALFVAFLMALTGCSGVSRDFHAPATVEHEVARMPAAGESGELVIGMHLWPSLERIQAAAPKSVPNTPAVKGPFVVLQSVRDPRWWSFTDAEIGNVEVRMVGGPATGTSGWLFSIGPFVIDVAPQANIPTPETEPPTSAPR